MNATDDPCGLDGVCSSCREATPTSSGTEPVDETLAGRRRSHRVPERWDTPLFDAVVAERGLPGVDDEDDPEEFCDVCLAGTESSQHQGGCPEGVVGRRLAMLAARCPDDGEEDRSA